MPPSVILRTLKNVFRPRDEWVIVFLGGFMLFIAVNTQTGWLYVVVAVLAALLVAGFVGPRLTLRGLEVVRLPVPPAWEGDTVTVRLRVRNPSRWRRLLVSVTDTPPFPTDDGKPVRFAVGQIPAGGGVTLEYPVVCRYRGARPLGDVSLATATPVGLFPLTRTFPAAGELLVYPRGPALSRIDIVSVAPRTATTSRTFNRVGHSYDFQGIRQYQFGDDTRFVHWPTTARTGQMMVREFRELGAQRLTIVIDNSLEAGAGPPGHTPLDDAARLAATLVAHAQQSAANVTLVAAHDDGRPNILHNARGPQALDWLARLQPLDLPHWSDAVVQAAPHLERQGRAVVLAARPVDDAHVEALLSQRLQLVVVLLEADTYAAVAEGESDWAASARRLGRAGALVRRHAAGDDLAHVLAAAGSRVAGGVS